MRLCGFTGLSWPSVIANMMRNTILWAGSFSDKDNLWKWLYHNSNQHSLRQFFSLVHYIPVCINFLTLRVRTDLEKSWKTAFFWKNHGILTFLPLPWKSYGFLKIIMESRKKALAELLLGCGIVVFPKLVQNFDPQSAEIWPLLKVLESTLLEY